MKQLGIAVVITLCAGSAFADASVREKTQVHLGGAIGAIANVFGGRATHEGLENSVVVKGDRKATTTGDRGEIVDLGEEKVYRVDYAAKTYKVVTFEELRKQFEEQKARGERNARSNTQEGHGKEYDVDFKIKETGQKQTINGFATHETVVTVTVHEKGKKIETSGGFILTSDMWMGPRVAAMREIGDFDRRYFQKLYGKSFAGVDMAQAALLMAQTPAFAKAMKVFAEKKSAFEGTPIRTNMTFETVGSPEENASNASSSPGSIVGGLMGRMRKRNSDDGPQHNSLFEASTEVLSASSSAPSGAVSLAGFKRE